MKRIGGPSVEESDELELRPFTPTLTLYWVKPLQKMWDAWTYVVKTLSCMVFNDLAFALLNN